MKVQVVRPVVVAEFLAARGIHVAGSEDRVDGGGVVEGVAGVVERRALVVGLKAEGRDRMQREAKEQARAVDLDRGADLHRPEVKQRAELRLGDVGERAPFAQPRGKDRRRRPQRDPARREGFLQGAGVVIAVDMREDQAVDEVGIDLGVGEQLGRVERGIDHHAAAADPQHKPRRALLRIGIKTVAAAKHCDPKARRHKSQGLRAGDRGGDIGGADVFGGDRHLPGAALDRRR